MHAKIIFHPVHNSRQVLSNYSSQEGLLRTVASNMKQSWKVAQLSGKACYAHKWEFFKAAY